MFGYVRPLKGELKVNEYEEYKAVYCTLCKSIGKHYGGLCRMALSYDLTFYVLLSLNHGFDCKNKKVRKGRCVVNPLKKCNFIFEEENIYKKASALTVLMTYHKLSDNAEDEKGLKKTGYKLLRSFMKGARKKAAADYPFLDKAMTEMMAAQSECERADASLDACCEPTAKALSDIFSELGGDDKMESTVLGRLGYFLGRWIYIMDAADDLTDDVKENKFNPFIKKLGLEGLSEIPPEKKEFIRDECNAALNGSVAMMLPAANLLNEGRYTGIINNVLHKGLPEIQREILFLEINKKQRKKSLQ